MLWLFDIAVHIMKQWLAARHPGVGAVELDLPCTCTTACRSSSRNKYDDYEDDPDYGRGSSKDRYGGFGGSSSKRCAGRTVMPGRGSCGGSSSKRCAGRIVMPGRGSCGGSSSKRCAGRTVMPGRCSCCLGA
jgi:hypothetical protein